MKRLDRLRGVLKAVEWTVSGDWSEDDLTQEAADFEAAPAFADTVRIDAATGRIVP